MCRTDTKWRTAIWLKNFLMKYRKFDNSICGKLWKWLFSAKFKNETGGIGVCVCVLKRNNNNYLVVRANAAVIHNMLFTCVFFSSYFMLVPSHSVSAWHFHDCSCCCGCCYLAVCFLAFFVFFFFFLEGYTVSYPPPETSSFSVFVPLFSLHWIVTAKASKRISTLELKSNTFFVTQSVEKYSKCVYFKQSFRLNAATILRENQQFFKNLGLKSNLCKYFIHS